MKWGIIGTGYIAGEFAKGAAVVDDAKLVGVVSRHEESGRAYAERNHVAKVYTDLDSMIDDAKPDIVYVATPNDCHYEAIMKILNKGLPVLSEKPMADNTRQLNDVLELAERKNLFIMEGMWTRCFPATRKVREWLRIRESVTF